MLNILIEITLLLLTISQLKKDKAVAAYNQPSEDDRNQVQKTSGELY